MKILDIALKDLKQSSRSAFALIFMFGIPILVTVLFYFMFGGMGGDDEAFSLPQTRVVVVNLDQGGADFESALANMPFDFKEQDTSIDSLGDLVLQVLTSPELSDLLDTHEVGSIEAARQEVDAQQSGMAIIIPEDFSATFSDIQSQATIQVYQDPTLSFGPAIVQSVLNQFMDQLSGTKIAINLVMSQQAASNPALIGQVVQRYLDISMQHQDPQSWVEVRSPTAPGQTQHAASLLGSILGPIMGGMMIFYAFYSGTASAQTILEEEEKGTLPRLFTTPTTSATILTGKFLAVFLTVIIQVASLLLLGRYVFRIAWGELASISLVAVGLVLAASSFGIFVNSILKNPKQGGIVYGAVLTVTGMLGMIRIFTLASGGTNQTLRTVSLFVPQGWAVEGLLQSMSNQDIHAIWFAFLGLLAWSAVFLVLGIWRFQKRYA
jgi:ABC-2 type transport system permease protein